MSKQYFKVIKETHERLDLSEITNHYTKRHSRFSLLRINNWKTESQFLVDKNHIDGNEIHFISCNAEIIIVNAETKRVITCLFPRPAQLDRYYSAVGKQTPKGLRLKAKQNYEMGLNEI